MPDVNLTITEEVTNLVIEETVINLSSGPSGPSNNLSAIWNAKFLQGIEISDATPDDLDVLIYNLAQDKWIPGGHGAVYNHNDTQNKQGGVAGEYYHLKNSAYGFLSAQDQSVLIDGTPKFTSVDLVTLTNSAGSLAISASGQINVSSYLYTSKQIEIETSLSDGEVALSITPTLAGGGSSIAGNSVCDTLGYAGSEVISGLTFSVAGYGGSTGVGDLVNLTTYGINLQGVFCTGKFFALDIHGERIQPASGGKVYCTNLYGLKIIPSVMHGLSEVANQYHLWIGLPQATPTNNYQAVLDGVGDRSGIWFGGTSGERLYSDGTNLISFSPFQVSGGLKSDGGNAGIDSGPHSNVTDFNIEIENGIITSFVVN